MSDERNFTRRRRGSHETAENGEGQRPRCLASLGMTSDERNFARMRRGPHEAAENGEGQRPRCLKWGKGRLS